MTKVTDFRNTWCEATEENYNKLILILDKKITFSRYSEVFIIERDLSWAKWNKIHLKDNIFKGYRQIKLISNDFYYADEEKEEDTFNKFGFETPEFEGEILKEAHGLLFGFVFSEKKGRLIPISWTAKDGKIWDYNGSDDCNLTPIKKLWYEIEDNFPCWVWDKRYSRVVKALKISTTNTHIQISREGMIEIECFRPATKEEVLKLVIEEN